MEKVFSSEPLERFTYHPQNDGTAIVYLRENIEKDFADNPEGDGLEFWKADEVKTMTTLGIDEIEDSFDELWVRGITESKSLEERIGEVEEITETLVAMALGEE